MHTVCDLWFAVAGWLTTHPQVLLHWLSPNPTNIQCDKYDSLLNRCIDIPYLKQWVSESVNEWVSEFISLFRTEDIGVHISPVIITYTLE